MKPPGSSSITDRSAIASFSQYSFWISITLRKGTLERYDRSAAFAAFLMLLSDIFILMLISTNAETV